MSELGDEIQAILEAEASQALDSGWGALTVDDKITGLTLQLEPAKLSSAPLEVHFDSDELLVCYPGRKNMVVEFFSDDPEEIKRQVRPLAAAVVAGAYRERHKEGTIEVEAEWPGAEGVVRAHRKPLDLPGFGSSEWIDVAYDPY